MNDIRVGLIIVSHSRTTLSGRRSGFGVDEALVGSYGSGINLFRLASVRCKDLGAARNKSAHSKCRGS